MSVINRVPQGFLGLLDAKTQGRTPLEVDPRVSPSLDLTAFYASDLTLETEFNGASVSAADIGSLEVPVEIPPGELWFVRGVSGQLVVPSSGNGYRFELAVDTNTGTGLHFLTGGDQFTQTQSQAESVVAVHNFTPWGIFGAGTIFGAGVTQLLPAASNIIVSVLFHRVIV